MSRKLFVIVFVTTAVCFVPILIDFGLVAWIVPTGWGIVSTINELADSDWRPASGFALYSAFYIGLFYAIARFIDFLIRFARGRRGIWTIQIIVIVGLFCCSFLHVLTYGSIQGKGGTYTFWTAIERYFERRSP